MKGRWKKRIGADSRSVAASVLLAVASVPATAAERAEAVVDRVQAPLWVERQGSSQFVVPGLVLRNRDRLRTGPDGRARIRLAEGSVVDLGSDTQLDINALRAGDETADTAAERSVFTAAIDVPSGSLYFRSEGADGGYRQRLVNVRVGAITARLHGADVWGRADSEADRICLLAGSITVVHPQDEARRIDEAQTCYLAPRDAAPVPVETATLQQLAAWTALTAVRPARVAQASARPVAHGQRNLVHLATLETQADALAYYDAARAAGYPARIQPLAVQAGGYHYAVRVGSVATAGDASRLAAQLARSTGISPLP